VYSYTFTLVRAETHSCLVTWLLLRYADVYHATEQVTKGMGEPVRAGNAQSRRRQAKNSDARLIRKKTTRAEERLGCIAAKPSFFES
jgi:hypothetical protein